MAGFCNLVDSLHVPDFAVCPANSPKVSALRHTFVRGPTSQFSISLIAQFVVKFLLGSPAEVRKRG
jgi:hypothetical protein